MKPGKGGGECVIGASHELISPFTVERTLNCDFLLRLNFCSCASVTSGETVFKLYAAVESRKRVMKVE